MKRAPRPCYTHGPDVLKVAECAKLAGVSQSTIRAKIARKELFGFRDAGMPTLIPVEDAKRWMEGRPTEPEKSFRMRIKF